MNGQHKKFIKRKNNKLNISLSSATFSSLIELNIHYISILIASIHLIF